MCLRMIEALVVLLLGVLVDGRWHVLHDHVVVGMRGSQCKVLVLLKVAVKSRITVLLMNLTRGLINLLIVRRMHIILTMQRVLFSKKTMRPIVFITENVT